MQFIEAAPLCNAIKHVLCYVQSQLSTCYAVSPKLEQHTQFTWEAQLHCEMHNKVGR